MGNEPKTPETKGIGFYACKFVPALCVLAGGMCYLGSQKPERARFPFSYFQVFLWIISCGGLYDKSISASAFVFAGSEPSDSDWKFRCFSIGIFFWGSLLFGILASCQS